MYMVFQERVKGHGGREISLPVTPDIYTVDEKQTQVTFMTRVLVLVLRVKFKPSRCSILLY